MNKISELQTKILDKLTESTEKDNTELTGETSLILRQGELIERLAKINPKYLEVVKYESKILVRQGLFDEAFDVQYGLIFSIPNWDRFITAINAFYETCYK
ncbi:MAG: hypothetical protein WCO84_01070 [bacterium]